MMPQMVVTGPLHDDALALLRGAGRTIDGPGAALAPAQALPLRRQVVPPGAVAGA
jgi:hypothetical protein